MANYHDRLQVVRYGVGLLSKEDFIKHIKSAFGVRKDAERSASGAVSRWYDGSAPILASREKIEAALIKGNTERASDITAALDLSKYQSIPSLLDRFDVSYDDIASVLTPDGIAEWNNRYHELPFMDDLTKMVERDSRSRLIMQCIIGSYNIYRRHSMLPGVLKERFYVTSTHRGDCRGTYIQFDQFEKKGIAIPFNAFPSGNYVKAFASVTKSSNDSKSKLEVIEARVLVGNAFLARGQKTIANKDSKQFVGLLTGIYDYGDTLLAERVFIEKVSDDPSFDDGFTASRLLPDSDKKSEVLEYKRVRDVVSNARDGQTLTTRLSRLELL